MSEGRVLSGEEKQAWLHGHGVLRTGPHAFRRKVCHWSYCDRCGLILLKNEISRKAAAHVCSWEDD